MWHSGLEISTTDWTEEEEREEINASSSSSSHSQKDSEDIPSSLSDEEVDPLSDPNSLETTIASLFPHDQLRSLQKEGKAFHNGWREGNIDFLPTYKYDVGRVAVFDSSEKLRGPSWCDRILYRTRQDRIDYEQRVKEAGEAKKKDEEMKKRGLESEATDDAVLFDYDPATDGATETEDECTPGEDEAYDDAAATAEETEPRDAIELMYYKSCQGILTSDHKPLEALFSLSYDAVVPELKAKVHHEIARDLDKAENESRPSLTIVVEDPNHDASSNSTQAARSGDANTVDFGEVAYDVPATRSLTVANTSSVPATFSFVETPILTNEPLEQIPPWFFVHVERKIYNEEEEKEKEKRAGNMDTSPTAEHTLHPGDIAMVDATACVKDMRHVRALNSGEMELEEILVLRVNGGRDHFISVHGKWLSTCFGRTVDDLTQMPESGARSLEPTAEAWERQKHGVAGRLSAPREIFRLTESVSELAERAVAEWSMTKSGSAEESSPPWTGEPHGLKWPFTPETWTLKDRESRSSLLALAREALDTNQSLTGTGGIFPPELSSLHRLEILAETLLSFLHSLSDGIVTVTVWQSMEQELIAREKAKAAPRSWEETQAWVLEKLSYSPAHSVSFTFVTFMLARVANEVAPVQLAPKQPPPAQLASSKKQPEQEEQKGENNNPQQQQPQQQQQSQLQQPSPASSAAFISAGSFRRRARSLGMGMGMGAWTGTSSSQSSTPSSSSGKNTTTNINTNTSSKTTTTTTPDSTTLALTYRHKVESALASVFSYYLISADVPVPPKDKEKRVSEARKRGIIEPFLRTLGVG